MRICSFLPSATEIVCALGLSEQLVGVSYACDYPPQVRGKPVVVRTRLPHTTEPAEIDRLVRAFMGRGESLYRIDLEALARLEPDLILTQDLCQVCAASPTDLREALRRLPRQPQVLSLAPRTLLAVFDDIARVGAATGQRVAADKLVADLRARLAQIEGEVARSKQRPRVLCLEWLDPPYVGGHWVPEMVARAGGCDVFGKSGQPSRRVSWDQVLASRPEVVVVMPCGYGLQQTVEEFKRTKLPAAWEKLSATLARRVFALDANSYFSRPSPRLVVGVALLAHILHGGNSLYRPPAGSLNCL